MCGAGTDVADNRVKGQKSMDDVTVMRIILYTQFLRFFFVCTNMSAGYVVVS